MKTMELAKALAVAATVLAACSAAAPAAAQAIVEYYHLDAIGSIRAVTDASGNVVERHDYLPFGEEWCGTAACGSVTPGQPRRFTGKERDAETELDYFGARYYESHIGRFTTSDPVQTWQENLVDPQRWNRYAYARNNPLRFTDPDGRVLELVGDHRREAFSMLANLVGSGGLTLVERDGRTFVGIGGNLKGPLAAAVAAIVADPKTATLNAAPADTWVGSKKEGRTLSEWGGGAVVGSEESNSGLTEIYVALNAGDVASWFHGWVVYKNISSDRTPLTQSNESVLAHELGHARGNMLGLPIYRSAATWVLAVAFENAQRWKEGRKNFKLQHNPTLWPKD